MEAEETKALRMRSSILAVICQQTFPPSLKIFPSYFSKQQSISKVCYWQACSSSLSFSIMQTVKYALCIEETWVTHVELKK